MAASWNDMRVRVEGLVEQHHHGLVAEDRLGPGVEQTRRALGQFGEDVGREDPGVEDGPSLERHVILRGIGWPHRLP